jgi:beta-alanine degradation protein BauB
MSSTSRPLATATVQADNERVRITEWRFAPATSTGFHRHEFDYVVVPLTTATLQIITSAGTSANQMAKGQAYFRTAGAEHEVVNENDFEVVFIETELK